MRKVQSVDDYISGFPPSTRKLLQQMRRTIRSAAPEAEEVISYQMPAFRLNGILVYFAAYEHHIGLYPTASGIRAFKRELVAYDTSKGTVRFPIDKPLPLALIRKIVLFRVGENVPPNPFEKLSAPAQRALANAGITSVKLLAKKTERQVAALHGLGPDAVKKLRRLLHTHRLRFSSEQ